MESVPYASATISRRFNTVALWYGYCPDEDVLTKNPAAKVKRPRINRDGQRRTHLTPLEHGLFLAAAAKMGPQANALATLLAMRGLRIAEACSLDVTDVLIIGSYDHVRFVGKGGDTTTVPLPIPCARAVRTAIGDRDLGPLLLNTRGVRLDRTCATRLIPKIAAAAQVNTEISPHSLRRSFVTTQLAMGVPLRDVQLSVRHKSPNTTVIYDRRGTNPDSDTAHAWPVTCPGLAGEIARRLRLVFVVDRQTTTVASPLLDNPALPDLADGQIGERRREVALREQLVDALLADAEHLRDLDPTDQGPHSAGG